MKIMKIASAEPGEINEPSEDEYAKE